MSVEQDNLNALVLSSTNDFEGEQGEFGLLKSDFKKLIDNADPIYILQALEARGQQLGKRIAFSLQEKEDLGEIWYYIEWQLLA